ncbi:MAG: peroxide stress protein YaaA [Pseudotabrizicola sp.]|uniref:peroxide stress protein YaaA n=1 Tax=Pseudotabrizicola sp. TaxID=2939647 RepID=UPI002726947A|nr:peroxide stress protein YaaA [Pseudotabrizicola sp.]MDO9638135.1 peroxide stress protein YaaA [Pseudotabrizicola sp.]
MLTVISPAKKLNEVPQALPDGHQLTDPEFGAQALELAKLARALSVEDLRKLSHISEPLARLNRDRFATFSATPAPGTIFPAVHCFAGDTYQGLDARTLSAAALDWASGHLRILSGLYGLLRPFDSIQAYRLEMGSRLANPQGADLYAFWGTRIARSLNSLALETGAKALINCASIEYFGAVDRTTLQMPVISPVFLEERDGQAKTVSFWAKRARGAMARYICEHQITDPADLRGFDLSGYRHQPGRSTDGQMVFLRQAPAQQAA